MTALLRLDNVGRRFGGLTALDAVSVTVAGGARHAVIGPNGAGKTTLVNLIAGTLRPSSGSIVFDDRDITGLSAPARARRGIGRTWQHPAVFRRLTAEANIALALSRQGAARNVLAHRTARRARAAELVADAGLADQAATPAGHLPYGLQRRLELAMALAARPRLLLLDEPSAGLDPDETVHLIGQIRVLPADITVVLIDHNLDLIWSLANTVTVLHHGRHLTTGTPDQIRADPHVRSAYLSTSDQPSTGRRPAATQAGALVLRVRDLRAGYHGAPVLDRLDLDVREGETVAVLGRNGAGKTTLLNSIGGLLAPQPPTRIELAGRPLPRRRPHHPARVGLALVPQGRRLFGPLTVSEHLTCARAAGRTEPGRTSGRVWTVDQVLALLPALAARRQHPAALLSGGEQQMLALARALLTNPRLLALDEPSEGLAPTVVDRLAAVIRQLADQGAAILIAEQNLSLALAVADRVCVLAGGAIALNSTPDAVRADPTILDDLLAVRAAAGAEGAAA